MIPEPAYATVTAKGQVTIRRSILAYAGIGPGDRVEFVPMADGRVEMRAADTRSLASLRGILKRPGQRVVSIEEMNETIERGWAGLIDMHDDGQD